MSFSMTVTLLMFGFAYLLIQLGKAAVHHPEAAKGVGQALWSWWRR
jgi:hypothetical protein